VTRGAPLHAPLTARSPHEGHRAATPLELLFDLVFVVAIAQAATGLHHSITAAHALEGLMGYLMVFFAIWWAWIALLFVPGFWIPAFLALGALELALPVWAEGVAPTTWHPHHIAERYGL